MSDKFEYDQGMAFAWVVGRYEGDAAKKILANAHAGIGSYLVLEDFSTRFKHEGIVAFRFPLDRPIPHHLTKVTDYRKIAEYDERLALRSGVA